MTAATRTITDAYTLTSEGALVVSDEAIDAFAEAWADEFRWLSKN